MSNREFTTQPLHLALVTETWPPEINGVAMTLGRLVEGVRGRGHRVEIVRPRQNCDARGPHHGEALLRDSLPIPRYTGLRLGLPCSGVLAARWRMHRPHLVHVATEGPLGRSALRAAHGLGIPVTSGFHTNFHDYSRHYGFGVFHHLVESYLRRFHNRTRRTLVPTSAQAGALAEIGFKGVEALGRGVDLACYHPDRRSEAMRATWGAGPDDLVCLHVGRVAPEKDIPLAIEAFRAIQADRRNAIMVVAGDGPERARLQAAHPDIRFTGVLDRAALAAAYASADLFVFPSLSETFGNVVLEAMASGTPVVAHRYAAPALHMTDGVNGWLVAVGDREGFIAAARAAALDPGRRERGRAARAAVLPHAWDGIIDRFLALIAEAIHDEPQRRML
jgi:glycosyltransferase involved in cell wall biosynthesis